MMPVLTFLKTTLREYFEITNNRYEGATDFRTDHPDLIDIVQGRGWRQRLSIRVHSKVIARAMQQFEHLRNNIRMGGTNLRGDLWDPQESTLYEIVLGNGEEFWKDITKGLLQGAAKLIIMARPYPDMCMPGYEVMRRWAIGPASALLRRIEEGNLPRLQVKVVNIMEL
jgi:hypothetical protein